MTEDPIRTPAEGAAVAVGDVGATLGDEWPVNPRIRQCAAHLACKFHDTRERMRVPGAHAQERYDWNELPGRERELLVETFYSLVHQGIIFCPVPAHYIGTGARYVTELIVRDGRKARERAAVSPPAATQSDHHYHNGQLCKCPWPGETTATTCT